MPLRESEVRLIRRLVGDGESIAQLARRFRVSCSTVASAAYGRTWRGVVDPPPLSLPPHNGTRPGITRLTPAQVRRARRDYGAGRVPIADLARLYGVTASTVRSAVVGDSWRTLTDVPPVPIGNTGGRSPALRDDEVRDARRLHTEGLSYRAIGRRLGVCASSVCRALKREGGSR